MRILLLALIVAQLATDTIAQDQVRGPATVTDGDTITVGQTRFRLHGVDAPESGQTCNGPRAGVRSCGSDAARLLSDLIAGQEVEWTRVGTANDKYGRMIAVCRAGGRNLNAEIVARGLAWSYREYSADFNACEDEAKKRGVGIWRAQQTMPPWEH